MKTDCPQLPWSNLKHPLVRNLAWCVFSTPLVNSAYPQRGGTSTPSPTAGASPGETHPRPQPADETGITPLDLEWLVHLDKSPASLQQWMQQCTSTRLGFQFEYYWQFWWQHRYPHLEHRFNIQLHQNGKTLGEVDAVSWDPDTGELIHSELAVKFYLGIESDTLPRAKRADSRFSWVGPNAIDRLDLKWRQLVDKQLRRLQPTGIASKQIGGAAIALPEHWRIERLTTRLIMRGRLFYPVCGIPAQEQPDYLHPRHLKGRWLRLQELGSLPACSWTLLARQQWLSPQIVLPAAHADVVSLAAFQHLLEAHFTHHKQPLQAVRMAYAANQWCEQERFFVVPDQWPSST